MKLCYAFRRGTFYPFIAGAAWGIPSDPKTRTEYLGKVNDMGFDGIELGFDAFGGFEATKERAEELQSTLSDAGTPCVAIRAGGGLCQPGVADQSRKRLEKAVEIAGWTGVGVVNTALSSPPRDATLDTGPSGARSSHGSSALATEEDFVRTAAALREVGGQAGAIGADITIEVHQHSIADSSWSTIHLLELTDSSHVFANPDLGNVLWTYEEPEESIEDCIVALAPYSKYWHCKSLQRVHIPELEHSYFIRTALPDGDIDYRFALGAMHEADYDGYFALEGTNTGDQLDKDGRSVEYIKSILAELED